MKPKSTRSNYGGRGEDYCLNSMIFDLGKGIDSWGGVGGWGHFLRGEASIRRRAGVTSHRHWRVTVYPECNSKALGGWPSFPTWPHNRTQTMG